jgi:hypothetical protein
MTCCTEEALQSYLEELLPEDERNRVRAHLEGCERCRTRLEAYRRLFSALDAMEAPPVPEGFADRVMEAWRGKARAVQRRRTRRRLFLGIASAAALLLPTAWIGWRLLPRAVGGSVSALVDLRETLTRLGGAFDTLQPFFDAVGRGLFSLLGVAERIAPVLWQAGEPYRLPAVALVAGLSMLSIWIVRPPRRRRVIHACALGF